MAQNNNDINKIEVIREINERYVVIKYFDAEVIYDKETKFINATKLCQHISKVTGKKKQLKHWIELKQTQKFIEDVSKKAVAGIPATENNDKENKKAVAGIPATENNDNMDSENQDIEYDENKLSYVVKLGSRYCTEIRGTYLHLDLIPQLCNWASKEYAFKISYIINYINGIKDYDSAYSKVKNDELKAKDDELESKTDEIKKLEEEHQKQLKAKDKEIQTKENEIKDLKKELKESEKKNEKKTTIIKKKDEKVKELEKAIKIKTEELEKLRETKSEDDIEIKKLKRDIKLLKSQLEEALRNNKTLIERMDDFIKAGEKEREAYKKREEEYKKKEKEREKQHREEMKQSQEELKEYKQKMNKMLTSHDILINQMSVIIKEKFKVETENKEIKSELKSIPDWQAKACQTVDLYFAKQNINLLR